MSRRLLLATPVVYLLSGCGTRVASSNAGIAASKASTVPVSAAGITGTVTVFAAASLTDAFQEMARDIQKQSQGARFAFNFGGSPTLRTQLSQGARADVFASADEPNMQGAQKDGSIAGQPQVFVQNKLVVIVPVANPAAIKTLQDLAKPGVKLVLAQPAVPVGNYARQSFAKMSTDVAFGATFAAQVAKNVVSDEADVKGVVSKVRPGEADAGVVYQTDVTAAVRPHVVVLDIPDQFNVIASYPITMVKGAPNSAGGQTFIVYVLSPAGQSTLLKYGFAPAPRA